MCVAGGLEQVAVGTNVHRRSSVAKQNGAGKELQGGCFVDLVDEFGDGGKDLESFGQGRGRVDDGILRHCVLCPIPPICVVCVS